MMTEVKLKLGDKVVERVFGGEKRGVVVSLPPINKEIAIITTGEGKYDAVSRQKCTIVD
ncbi:MAG: hypothetical protein PHV37_01895 [Candidatus Gastranaerophilales bacterium]|nr:hypothetical protein [Candidatus Gastranaerophilales bacterium]